MDYFKLLANLFITTPKKKMFPFFAIFICIYIYIGAFELLFYTCPVLYFTVRTFDSSFEKDFAASTRHNAVVTSRRLVPTHQTHFGRRGWLSQG